MKHYSPGRILYWILCCCNPLQLIKWTQITYLKWPMSGKPICSGLVCVCLLCVHVFMPVVGQMGLLCCLWSVRCMFCIVRRDRWQVASGHVSFTGFTWSDFRFPAFLLNLIWHSFPTVSFSLNACLAYVCMLYLLCLYDLFTAILIFSICLIVLVNLFKYSMM